LAQFDSLLCLKTNINDARVINSNTTGDTSGAGTT